MSVFNVIFFIVMASISIFTALLLVSSYYSKVYKGEFVEFEINGVKDSGIVEYIKDDLIYVITESNPDSNTVITYENIL